MDMPHTQSHNSRPDRDTSIYQTEPATYGDLIVRYLSVAGVRHIFGVPGGSIEPFFDAVARAERNGPGPTMVVSRHETGAAFMADGSIRESGHLSVCCSTTGPGATNLITGVANAYEENLPLLVLTAQTPRAKFGRKTLQDSSCSAIDVVGMFNHCTKYSTLVSHPDQLEHKLITALTIANTAPKGPVHLSLPADIVNTALSKPLRINPDLFNQPFELNSPIALEQLKTKLNEAERVLLYVGENCRLTSDQLIQFAEQTNAAIISDPTGKCWVDETHPRYCGVFGFSGHPKARALVMEQQYDLLLALGTQAGELGTSGWEPKLLNNKMVHIDDNSAAFMRTPEACLHVCGSLPDILAQLSTHAAILRSQGKQWLDLPQSVASIPMLSLTEQAAATDNAVPIKPQRVMHTLAQTLPDDTRIFIDAGNAWAWSIRYMQRRDNRGLFRIAMAYGSMTWAIGASIGSAVSNPKAPHVCITGDGSYLMSGQEITVAAQQQLPLVMIILNDNALGMVKHGQRLGGAEQTGFALPEINFALMAEAMGIEGIVVESPWELEAVDFERLFAKRGPTIIDIRIDPEEIPPMGERIKGLATSK
ncbi:thiamine pyrophosphate-binding protein [Pontibacterium sp.]|uniref:thiamine pyrophosphate-binding protein n=1 Tax=Pontibacterium sp. TaxID=2036026 RepID=UPI003514D579